MYAQHVSYYQCQGLKNNEYRPHNRDVREYNDKVVISLSRGKQKPFDIISATYQEGCITRQECSCGEYTASHPVTQVQRSRIPFITECMTSVTGHH